MSFDNSSRLVPAVGLRAHLVLDLDVVAHLQWREVLRLLVRAILMNGKNQQSTLAPCQNVPLALLIQNI